MFVRVVGSFLFGSFFSVFFSVRGGYFDCVFVVGVFLGLVDAVIDDCDRARGGVLCYVSCNFGEVGFLVIGVAVGMCLWDFAALC